MYIGRELYVHRPVDYSPDVLFLKILLYRKLELVDEDLLEGIEVVLLIENEHRLLVVDRIGAKLHIISQLSAHGELKNA